jgi:molybdopterin converting factor small subunit
MNAVLPTQLSSQAPPIAVVVLLFAGIREEVGLDRIVVDCPSSFTVAELKSLISDLYPPVRALVSASRVAVGNTFVDESASLELLARTIHCFALIPPVSGG